MFQVHITKSTLKTIICQMKKTTTLQSDIALWVAANSSEFVTEVPRFGGCVFFWRLGLSPVHLLPRFYLWDVNLSSNWRRLTTFFIFLREGFKKKVWNFPHFRGGRGVRPISTLKKKNRVSKCIKSPKYSFKSNLFFSYGGGLTLRIFLSSRFWFVLYQRLFLGKLPWGNPLDHFGNCSSSSAFPNSMLARQGGFWCPPSVTDEPPQVANAPPPVADTPPGPPTPPPHGSPTPPHGRLTAPPRAVSQ